jgi:hypothetical protein
LRRLERNRLEAERGIFEEFRERAAKGSDSDVGRVLENLEAHHSSMIRCDGERRR